MRPFARSEIFAGEEIQIQIVDVSTNLVVLDLVDLFSLPSITSLSSFTPLLLLFL